LEGGGHFKEKRWSKERENTKFSEHAGKRVFTESFREGVPSNRKREMRGSRRLEGARGALVGGKKTL